MSHAFNDLNWKRRPCPRNPSTIQPKKCNICIAMATYGFPSFIGTKMRLDGCGWGHPISSGYSFAFHSPWCVEIAAGGGGGERGRSGRDQSGRAILTPLAHWPGGGPITRSDGSFYPVGFLRRYTRQSSHYFNSIHLSN